MSPQLSGIYDSAWIQPIAKIRENLSILTLGKWMHYWIDYEEPIPPGPAMTVEMVTFSGAAGLAAGGTITKRIVTILQLNDSEFMHLRWEPLDNVEGVLWEQAGQARFQIRNVHSRVDRNTRFWDPHLVTTTFWVMGLQRDMNLEVRNPMAYNTPVARFLFWGWRYLIRPWSWEGVSIEDQNKLGLGDLETVKKYLGQTTWLPAEGKQS